MPRISRESVPVLLAQNISQIVEKYIKCGGLPDVGRDVVPDAGSDVGLDGLPACDELCITSLDGSFTQNVLLDVVFPRIKISWQHKGSLYSDETELYVNDRFISIKCTNCSRTVTAVLLRKKIQCPWCAQVNNFSSPKKVIDDLHKAHQIIEQYDPSWVGLQAKGQREWLDGY